MGYPFASMVSQERFLWAHLAAALLFLAACSARERSTETRVSPAAKHELRLAALRKAHPTQLFAAPTPPDSSNLEVAYYDAPLGKNVAYVTRVKEGPKRPAIVWLHGGWDWSISSVAWEPGELNNDQSASVFHRFHNIAQLYPAPRGANDNPGHWECFFGEVDDVLAAAEFLAARPDVDPTRIYLGGHSTGATLALLAAASTRRFSAVFTFGPMDDLRNYERSCLPEDVSAEEAELRAPIEFLSDIVSPTFIIEGEHGSRDALERMRARVGSAPVKLIEIPNADHWEVLWPGCSVAARAIQAESEVELANGKLSRFITQQAISAELDSVRRRE